MKNFLMFFFSLPLLTGCVGAGIATFGVVVGTPDSSGLIGAGLPRQERVDFPFGARWVKKSMTRDSRRADWIACGGDEDLKDGFRAKNEVESFELFESQLAAHNKQLWMCMNVRGYQYFNDGYAFGNPKLPGNDKRCDTHCLYP